jgi:hypothetical protein
MTEDAVEEKPLETGKRGQDDIMSVLLANEKRGGAGGSGTKTVIPGQQDSGSDSSDEEMQVIPKMAEPSPGLYHCHLFCRINTLYRYKSFFFFICYLLPLYL